MPQDINSATVAKLRRDNPEAIRSLFRVRMALGLIGFVLPTALILHGQLVMGAIQPSISHTYHTPMGDFLVGCLFAIGVFLLSYKEFNAKDYLDAAPNVIFNRYWDRWVARLAGLGAIGVALFPVDPKRVLDCAEIVKNPVLGLCSSGGFTEHGFATIQVSETGFVENLLHFASAGMFFVCILILCWRFFPRNHVSGAYVGRNQRGDYVFEIYHLSLRNCIYYAMGLVMAACIAGLIYMAAKEGSAAPLYVWLEARNFFFWFETIAVWAFAAAWITKSFDFWIPRGG
ncbi:hypothetical protein ACS3SW_07055 [Roseobacteraceae bacterium S113]